MGVEGCGYEGEIVGRTIKERDLGMVAHTCHPSSEKAGAGECHKFEASLGYTVRLCLKK